MKGYSVWICRQGNWWRTDSGLNVLAAEAIRDYYADRGIKTEIRYEEE